MRCKPPPAKLPFDVTDIAREAIRDRLRSPHDALEIEATWVAARTETRLEDVVIPKPADADAWERRCVEDRLRLRVMLPPDERFDPPRRASAMVRVRAPAAAAAEYRSTPRGFVEYAYAPPRASRDERIATLRTCTRQFPDAADCFLVLAESLDRSASGERDLAAHAEVRAAYARFLELAPADDRRAPRLRRLLAAAP